MQVCVLCSHQLLGSSDFVEPFTSFLSLIKYSLSLRGLQQLFLDARNCVEIGAHERTTVEYLWQGVLDVSRLSCPLPLVIQVKKAVRCSFHGFGCLNRTFGRDLEQASRT